MKPVFYATALFCSILYGLDKKKLIDCSIVFEQRKDELKEQIDKIEDNKKTLKILKEEVDSLFAKKENDIASREQNITQNILNYEQIKKDTQSLVEKNRQILEAIQKAKNDKIGETYAKMRDSKAAPIIEAMEDKLAASILFSLDPKVMGKILAKMTPKRASEITAVLDNGPPFENSKEANDTSAEKK